LRQPLISAGAQDREQPTWRQSAVSRITDAIDGRPPEPWQAWLLKRSAYRVPGRRHKPAGALWWVCRICGVRSNTSSGQAGWAETPGASGECGYGRRCNGGEGCAC
jgi:hypothetical protein